MLVALIGVFGVLVLIPFSVQQAQIGLDQDVATLVALNSVEEMQVRGLLRVNSDGDLNLRGLRMDTTSDPTAKDSAFPEARNVPGIVSPVLPRVVYGVDTAVVDGEEVFGVISSKRPQAFHFDPLAVANVGYPVVGDPLNPPQDARNPDCFNFADNANELRNPDFLTRYLPASRNDLRLPVVTAVNNLSTVFNVGGGVTEEVAELVGIREADRIFRSLDELVFGDQDNFTGDGQDVSDVDLPQPVFDVSAGGRVVRRQSSGRISWSAVFVPEKGATVKATAGAVPTATNRYRVFVMVYKDRSFLAGVPNASAADAVEDDGDSQMFAAEVNRAMIEPALLDASGAAVTQNFGYVQALNQIHVDYAEPLQPISLAGVRKDDWVMLINRKPVPDYVGQPNLPIRELLIAGEIQKIETDEPEYDIQLGFARVTGTRDVDVDDDGDIDRNDRGVINVEGGGFNFFYDDITSGNFGIPGPVGATNTDTYVIHLRNVVTVYERTVTLEQNSAWN